LGFTEFVEKNGERRAAEWEGDALSLWRSKMKADPMGREGAATPGGPRALAAPSLISNPHREMATRCCLHEGGEMGNHPTINGGEAKVGRFSWWSNTKEEFRWRRWEGKER
jgi:hypothetical protein